MKHNTVLDLELALHDLKSRAIAGTFDLTDYTRSNARIVLIDRNSDKCYEITSGLMILDDIPTRKGSVRRFRFLIDEIPGSL